MRGDGAHLAHRTFHDVTELDRAIHQAVADLNKERAAMHPCHNLSRLLRFDPKPIF